MKDIIQDISEITDSREMLESKPHPFTFIFIYIILMILVSVLIWSYFSEIDIVVRASGIVRPNKKISVIRNKVTGKVEKLYFKNGDMVKKGEVLYIIEHKDLQLQRESLLKKLSKKRIELDNLIKYKKSILDNKNYFDKQLLNEEEYYYKVLKYLMNLKELRESAKLIFVRLQNTEETIINLEKLLSSIKIGKNLFENKENEYYVQYVDYTIKIRELESLVEQSKRSYEKQLLLKKAGAVSDVLVENAKNAYEKSRLDLEEYKNGILLNIQSSLSENRKKLNELKLELSKIVKDLENYDKQSIEKIITLKYQTEMLIEINDSIKSIEMEIEQLEDNLKNIEINIENCFIKAPITGYINITTDINKGDYLITGTEIATIIPKNDTEYRVIIYVSNKDIANIKIGDKIKYHFHALPYKEYGELDGTVVRIGVDSKFDQNKGNSFYLVEADIENRPLYSYKGEKAEVKVGMTCDAFIITKTKKVLYYFLEKIDLKG